MQAVRHQAQLKARERAISASHFVMVVVLIHFGIPLPSRKCDQSVSFDESYGVLALMLFIVMLLADDESSGWVVPISQKRLIDHTCVLFVVKRPLMR